MIKHVQFCGRPPYINGYVAAGLVSVGRDGITDIYMSDDSNYVIIKSSHERVHIPASQTIITHLDDSASQQTIDAAADELKKLVPAKTSPAQKRNAAR